MQNFSVEGRVVDILHKKIYTAMVQVAGGRIHSIQPIAHAHCETLAYIMPGFIDSHVHIESSMLVPAEFAKMAVVHGTVATVSDPHEIANVCGIQGVEFMIENGKTVPFKFQFGAPSCVPATQFETAGATLDSTDVTKLLASADIKYLSEMMNFPGVLNKDPEVMKKIAAAKANGKPIDGHAPGLRGDVAKRYITAATNPTENGPGDVVISTDHECFTAEEALDKLQHGMKILIREGSAAKNFEALALLINDWPHMMMFCSDDKHPDSLLTGHINQLCTRAVQKGIDVFKVLQVACINPILHYNLAIGWLQPGQPADFILVENLSNFHVLQTYIDGVLVADGGRSAIETKPCPIINQFNCKKITPKDLEVAYHHQKQIPVIEALEGQLITNKLFVAPCVVNTKMESNTQLDVLKMVVINRYHATPIATAWVKGFQFGRGAIASTVAHDSHNIIAVGVDDESLCQAINLVIEARGGIGLCDPLVKNLWVIPLPVAGLMSDKDGYEVAAAYTKMNGHAALLSSNATTPLSAPFMTLSFMALLVIPHIKLSDKGLFDGDTFSFINNQ